MRIIAFALILLAGCTTHADRYKIIGVPYETTRTVIKKVPRKCPPLPALPPDATQSEITAHHKTVIELYARCTR